MVTRRKEILNAVNDDLIAAVLRDLDFWIRDDKNALVLSSILLNTSG